MATNKKKKTYAEFMKETYGATNDYVDNVVSVAREKALIKDTAEDNNIAPLPKTAKEIADMLVMPSAGELADMLASPAAFRSSVKTAPAVAPLPSSNERNKVFEKGAFDDGYQFGDVLKTTGATATDLILSAAQGVGNAAEGLTDLAGYGIANVADKLGAERIANSIKYDVKQNKVDSSMQELRDSWGIDNNSVLGEIPRGVGQGVGQVMTMIATGGLGAAAGLGQAGVSALTLGTMGLSSMGGGMSEAYQNGATDGQALAYGAMQGAIDTITEMAFGGLGKTVKALGLSRGIGGLDDIFAKKLTSKISNHLVRNAIQYGIKATGEGLEEVAAGALSAVAKNLTYKSDEELSQLIKDENLLDQFIIGTLTSAVSQGVDLVNSVNKKTDFVTGFTDSEQKVVDAEYKKRLAEEEKDGNKLDKKAKNKLYDEVTKDLEKGYISTETIEEVLGGEDYSNYQRELKREQDLDNELNELRNMKSSEMTDIQTERMAELKARKPNTEMMNTLKFGIDENIRNGIKDSRLAESYNEQERRKQAFEADVSQYDEKHRATIQKAIDSKILNNSRRTHEFVDFIARVSADKGVPFDFADNKKIKESGFAIEDVTVNGYVTKDGITLNIDSKKALNKVVGHEITHILEGTELYNELQKSIIEYAKSKKDYQGRYDSLTKLYNGIEGADINAELTADLVGDYLFTDEAFINHLSTQNRNVFQKIYDEVKYLVKMATAGSKEARQLEKVKRTFDKIYRESGKVSDNTKNSTKLSLTLDKNQNLVYNRARGDTYARTDEFRRLQEESQRMSDEEWNFYLRGGKNEVVRRRISSILQRQMDACRRSGSFNNGSVTLTGKNNQFNMYEDVTPSLFHDVFEVARKYLTNGELVDLHTIKTTEDGIGYDDCYNYLSDDGLSGFSITPDGDLISVFNASDKGGFLRAISGIVKEKAKTLDCYKSPNQNLMEMYERFFGFKTASVMDYNMEYDHDNIAANHDMPQIAFMVNTEADVETRAFTKDQYDEALEYRNSFVNQETDNKIAPINKTSSNDGVFFDEKNPKFSLSDSDGKSLTKEQNEYFKNSKMRDDNGNLKVMYHGSQDAGFHIFDASMSDDGTSFFFVDRNDVAASYSGTSETYEAQTIRTAEDMNKFLVGIGYDSYKAIEKDGKFELLENNEHVAYSDTAQGLYEEFCWYEGVGEGDANYKVYLNLTNPLVIDAEGRNWNNISREFSQEIADRYNALTAEERAALTDLAEWGEYSVFRDEILSMASDKADGKLNDAAADLASAYEKLGGANVNLYDAFSIASENFSEESIKQFAAKQMNTRDYAKMAKEQGYDGVIFKNIHDNGGYSNGIEGASTVAIAFSSEQIKSVANEKPTKNPDIRKSLSADGDKSKRNGRYNVYGDDIRLQAPIREDIAQNATTTEATSSKMEQVAPAVDNAAPIRFDLAELYNQKAELEKQMTEALDKNDSDTVNSLYTDTYLPLLHEIRGKEEQNAILNDSIVPTTEAEANKLGDEMSRSITDADAPPQAIAPIYDESENAMPDNPFENRDYTGVGDRKQKAYMYENPEVKPFFQEAAGIMLNDLRNSQRGERLYITEGLPGSYGAESYGHFVGVKRHTTDDIADLLDSGRGSGKGGYTYAELEKGLNAIIEDNGKENNACSKRIEFALNSRLLYGYRDVDGMDIPPNQDYINLLNEKQITEYNTEAFNSFMNSADVDDYAPPAEMIAPLPEKGKAKESKAANAAPAYEAIRPQSEQEQQPRMKRADNKNTAPDGMEERSWYETSTGSEAVDNIITPDDIPDDVRYYQVKSNKKTLETANTRLARDGFAKSREYFEGRMTERKLTAEDIALGERLIQEAAKAGDAKAVRDLIIDVSIIGTELGQSVQALSMIRRLTPEGQLKALFRTVERGKAKGDKAFDGVEVTEDMAKKITDTIKEDGTFDQEDLDAAVEDVKQEIADNMKTTATDYINAWRYLSMLGNPKTHIRNVVSNVAMFGTRAVKNAVARTIETIAPIKNRTKTWRPATKAVKSFSKQTTKEMESVIKGDNKYSDESSIKSKRKIFFTAVGNFMADTNSNALEAEDSIFSKPAFRLTLQEYLTANGIKTEADIKNNPKLVAKAKEYALDESRRATFRQDSYLANKINEIEKKNPIYGVAIGATMPFKKTPINVAKTGMAYSPLGFARNIYDAVKLAKGEMEASEAIDHLAQTLTGTSLALIGYALAESGILNGAGGDDKEDKYDYQLGEQSYSFNYGGDTYSLSWLSPVAMPLFAGANAYETLVEKHEWDANVVIDTLGRTLDPMSEMSFLSSLDNVLSSYDSGIDKFIGSGGVMAQSYASQFVPTALSQIAAAVDDTKRSTKVSGDSGFEFGEEMLNNLKYKIPGLRNQLEPTTDIWGNEAKQTGNTLLRSFESFLSPANKREGISTAVDDELKALYRVVGESEILPAIPDDYINYKDIKYDLSATDYTEYKQNYGQAAYDLMEKLFDTDTYNNASPEEKADMIGRVYDYARDNAKKQYFVKFGVEYTNAETDGVKVYKENPIKGAIEADLPVDEYVFKVENPEKYKFFKNNGISYATYKAADEDGKRAYTWAYENPGKYTMSKVISDDFMEYYGYKTKMNDIAAGNTSDSGIKDKDLITNYIFSLDLDYGQQAILYRSKYSSAADKAKYNPKIIDYLNSRDDVSYNQMVAILKEFDMTVDNNGNIYWD